MFHNYQLVLCGHPNIITCYVHENSLASTMLRLLTANLFLFDISNSVINDILSQKTTYEADEYDVHT